MRYEDEDKKLTKRTKHRPNQPGVGMRILNEHDADDALEEKLLDGKPQWHPLDDAPDDYVPDELYEKYVKKS